MMHEGQGSVCRRELRQEVRHLWAQGSVSQRQLADTLCVPRRTLHRWCNGEMPAQLPGRPKLECSAQQLDAVRASVNEVVGRTTVAKLKESFPGIARSVLESVLGSARAELRRTHRSRLARLDWSCPGTVWAADFTQLDGRGSPWALAVRDLASRAVLHAGIADSPTANVVIDALCLLFAEHGAPLALKADNGSCFMAGRTKRLLSEHGVLTLYSPPGTPQYNGACEAGMGPLKDVARDVAWRDHQREDVDPEALAGAMAILNARPVGRAAASPAPADLWRSRRLISDAQRCQALALYRRHSAVRRVALGIANHAVLPHPEQASLDRYAVREALCEMNLLTIRRR